MAKPILYHDCCALNRPFDDLRQPRVAAEAQAVQQIIALVEAGAIRLARSAILTAEVRASVDQDRQRAVLNLLKLASSDLSPAIAPGDKEFQWLRDTGVKTADALHILSAKAGKAYLVTTDDAILKKAARIEERLGVKIVSPIHALDEVQ